MVRDITDKEIHDAIFDIGDSKAQGPDGFTAMFFKTTWPIIGEEVCFAVKDFFTNGKLLAKLNATLVTLVQKISNLNKVSDFRPIAMFYTKESVKSLQIELRMYSQSW